MGLSSSKTVQSNDPWGPAQPYIIKGMQQTQRVFDSQQGDLEKYAKMQRDTYGKFAPGAEQGITGAQGLVNNTIAGKYLNGNPYLERQLALTRADTTNAVNGQYESAGRYGSGMHAGILAKAIADSENGARYANYANERQNQIGAVGQAQGLMGGSQSLLNNAADLPWVGVGAMNGNIRQASNGYGTTTSTSNPSFGQMLLGAASGGLNAYLSNPNTNVSDRRAKMNIELVEAGPLNLYEWDYLPEIGIEGRFRGVMADEVPAWMLGPTINGFQTVYYTPERVG
jgi:hypothetical protein